MNPNDLKQFMPLVDDSALRHFREMEDLARPSIANAAAASLLLSDASVGSQIASALELSERFTDTVRDAMSQFRDKYTAESALPWLGNATLKSLQDELSTEFLPSAIDSAMLKSFPNNFPYGVSPVVDRQRDLEVISKQLLAGVSPVVDQQGHLEILSKQLLAGVSQVVDQQRDVEAFSKQLLAGVSPVVDRQRDLEILSKQLLAGVSQPSIDSWALKALQESPNASAWSNMSYTGSLLAKIEAAASVLSISGASQLNDFLGTMRAGLDAVSVRESFFDSIGLRDASLQNALSGFNNVLIDQFAAQVHTPADLLKTAAGVSVLTDFLGDYELDAGENQHSPRDLSATELTAEVERLTTAVKSTSTGADVTVTVEQLVEILAHEISKRQPTVQQRLLMNYVIPNLVAALVQVTIARLMFQPPSAASPVSEKQNVIAVTAHIQDTGKATVTCGQGRLVIRLKPDHESDAIATTANGTQLRIAQWQDGWALVEISDGETSIRGWVAGAFLKRDAEQHSAPR